MARALGALRCSQAIAQKLEQKAFIGQERMAGGLLYIVNRGLAIKNWRCVSRGKVWGEDMILDNVSLIDYSEAVAMTYLEVFTLDRPSLDAASKQFPTCGARVTAAARRMLIQRTFIKKVRAPQGSLSPRGLLT